VPWWANLGWCIIFQVLWQSPRAGVWLAAVGLLARFYTVLGTLGSVWMLSGIALVSVIAFYALTLLWPWLLVLLLRKPDRATVVAGWMVPLAAVEGVGVLSAFAGMLVAAVLGSPQIEIRLVIATAFAVLQFFFLLRTARTV